MNAVAATLVVVGGMVAFLLPGWLAARRLRLPGPLLTGFAISALGWFHLVLLYSAAGWPLTRAALLGTWAALVVVLIIWIRPWNAPAGKLIAWPPLRSATRWPWAVAATIGLASVALRAVIDPLSGWDNAFRWHHLAEEILHRGTLDFYPATTAAHFEIMAWCDGMPPLVSLLNFWVYLVAGEARPVLAAGRVIAEACLIVGTIAALARRWGGDEAFWPAAGLWTTSSLALWSVAMGQETGLTALALAGVFLFLPGRDVGNGLPQAAAAGLLAALGALSREYGLAFGALGGLALLVARRPSREIVVFGVLWLGLSLSWYLRNLVITGNPFHPMGIAGLFPRLPSFEFTSAAIAAQWGWTTSNIPFGLLGIAILATAGSLLLAGCLAAWRRTGGVGLAWCGVAMMVLLWIWSVPQTAGGLIYGLRVLSPALALLAAIGAASLSGFGPVLRRTLGVVAILTAADAAKRAWVLPVQPFHPPWGATRTVWARQHTWEQTTGHHPGWAELHRRFPTALVLVDGPAAHISLQWVGARVTMWFSPAAQPLFDPTRSPAEVGEHLAAAGVTHLALSLRDPIALNTYARIPYFRDLLAHREPIGWIGGIAIFDVLPNQPAS